MKLCRILEKQISSYINNERLKMCYTKPFFKWTPKYREIYKDYIKGGRYNYTTSSNFMKTLILCPPCIFKCNISPIELDSDISYSSGVDKSINIINSILNIDITRTIRDLYIYQYKLYITSLKSYCRPIRRFKVSTVVRYDMELGKVEIDFIGSDIILDPIRLKPIQTKGSKGFRWFVDNSYKTLYLKK